MDARTLWRIFCAAEPSARYAGYEAWHFELSEAPANELLRLVLLDEKLATTSSVSSFGGERLLEPGDYNVVTDWDGNAACVIETTHVDVMPFNEVPWALAELEGEDEYFDAWYAGHKHFLKAEAAELGTEYADDMPVVFEQFRVVFRAVYVAADGSFRTRPELLAAIEAAEAEEPLVAKIGQPADAVIEREDE